MKIDFTFLIAALTLLSTLILGIINYRLQARKIKLDKLKTQYKIILQNTLGFLELEELYSKKLSEYENTTATALKRKYRKRLSKKINSSYSSKVKIQNKLNEIER